MPDGRGGVRRRGQVRVESQHRAGVVTVVAGLAVATLCAVGWRTVYQLKRAASGLSTSGSEARPLHGETVVGTANSVWSGPALMLVDAAQRPLAVSHLSARVQDSNTP